jgi:hypothetical protein
MFKNIKIALLIFNLSFSSVFGQHTPKDLLPAIVIENIETAGVDNTFKSSYEVDFYDNIIKIYCKIPAQVEKEVDGIYYKIISENKYKDFDSTWVNEGTLIKKYSNLNSGDYNIFIKYTTKAGLASKVLSFKVKIKRPWWRTWWFWGASFISLFGLFYGRERFLKFWADEEKKHYRQIVELELRTLQLQMNPHFIFNALNSIQSYVMTHDALTANNYLSKFAHLIRMFLDSSRSRYISLSEEVKLLNLYIEMESLRFEEKFEFKIEIDPEVNKYIEIPTMILQPFVENAINHGIRYKKDKGFLKINFFYTGRYLICRMEDNGVGRKVAKQIQAKTRKGYRSQGLKITAERLMTYNKINETNIEFSVSDLYADPNHLGDVGTLVTVKFPI